MEHLRKSFNLGSVPTRFPLRVHTRTFPSWWAVKTRSSFATMIAFTNPDADLNPPASRKFFQTRMFLLFDPVYRVPPLTAREYTWPSSLTRDPMRVNPQLFLARVRVTCRVMGGGERFDQGDLV
uniref:Uncharacterized protein n=1 Tax=Opuntia streptacantha TaxID=393608 RepID=A0A7C9DRX4_OPUST